MGQTHEINIRVRYHEVDGQGRVHHGIYINYFERARVEMLRAAGLSYKEIETSGLMLVVSEMNLRYFLPAEFDDVLTVRTKVLSAKGARVRHEYDILRGDDLLVNATSTIACVDGTGRPRRLPPEILRIGGNGDARG